MNQRPEYCRMADDSTPEGQVPCPDCGATIEGKDPVKGICQARKRGPPPDDYGLALILVHRDTGKPI